MSINVPPPLWRTVYGRLHLGSLVVGTWNQITSELLEYHLNNLDTIRTSVMYQEAIEKGLMAEIYDYWFTES